MGTKETVGRVLKKAVRILPGIGSYQDKESIRDSDKKLRDHISSKLAYYMGIIERLKTDISHKGSSSFLKDLDDISRQMDKISRTITFASRGYAGVFDSYITDEKALSNLFKLDQSLKEEVDLLDSMVSKISEKNMELDSIFFSDIFCTKCHEEKPHSNVDEGEILDTRHVNKIACVTCHTGKRPGKALKSRSWNKFTKDGKPVTKMRVPGWIPKHKWYTGKKLGHLPILGSIDLMSKIYPFNVVKVTWFIVRGDAALDDVIIVPEVKAADANKDGETTVEEMQKYENGKYKDATLVTKEFNFSVTHSTLPSNQAFSCQDCHGEEGYVIKWKELGYNENPYEL